MTIKTVGFRELGVDMETMRVLLQKPELVTRDLDRLMRKHAPVRTGHLKSTIYHKGNVAGAEAKYAGYVEEMEPLSKFAYATEAIKRFDVNDYADAVTEPISN